MPYGFWLTGNLGCDRVGEDGELSVGDAGGDALRSLGEEGRLDQFVLDTDREEAVEIVDPVSDFSEDLLECLLRDLVKLVAEFNSDRTGEVVTG
jgi:hypothetical protein